MERGGPGHGSHLHAGHRETPYKYFDLPLANYGSSDYDRVVDADGQTVGLSMFTGYSADERRGLSLAPIDASMPEGTELKVVGGEPEGGRCKTTVEPHRQFAARVIVRSVPYSTVGRADYLGAWRTAYAK